MWIKEVVTVGFDPVKEYKAIQRFERENDLRDWVKSESTVCTAFTRNKFVIAEGVNEQITT